jgi:hypothetical protein
MPDKPKKRARKPPKPVPMATEDPPLVDKTKPLVEQVTETEAPFLDYDDVVRVMGEFKVDLHGIEPGVAFYVDPKNDDRIVVIPRTRELPGGFALLLDRAGIEKLYDLLAMLMDYEEDRT